MKPKKLQTPALIGVFTTLFLYLIFIVMILVFSKQLLSDVLAGISFSRLRFLSFSLVLPIFLIGGIVLNIVRLVKQRRSKAPGATFKAKLLVFFTFIVLISSIPQGFLALTFINTTMESWFSSGTEEALKGGLQIAIEYNKLASKEIKSFGSSRVFGNILDGIIDSPESMWLTIQSIQPMIHTIEIYNSKGTLFLFKGDDRAKTTGIGPVLKGGVVSRYSQQGISILKTRRDFTSGGKEYSAVISTILPKNFDLNASKITKAIQLYNQFHHFRITFFWAILVFFIYFSLPLLLLSILASFLLSDEIIKPVIHLEEAINKVIEGDYSHRVLSKQKDDLANLVNSFNKMVSELEQSRKNLVQNEKVVTWQEIAQRMAHEIKNPLTPIKLSAQRILKKYREEPDSMGRILEPSIGAIIREVENLTTLIQQFRDFARLPIPRMREVSIKELIDKILPLYSTSFPGIDMDFSMVKDISLRVDPDQIYSVLTNLVSNAIGSLDSSGGEIQILTDNIKKSTRNYCRIQIRDTGSGISDEVGEKIFNPYFTTKENGTGLGLSIVERIIIEHKGQIWFESELGVGTTFFVDLPL